MAPMACSTFVNLGTVGASLSETLSDHEKVSPGEGLPRSTDCSRRGGGRWDFSWRPSVPSRRYVYGALRPWPGWIQRWRPMQIPGHDTSSPWGRAVASWNSPLSGIVAPLATLLFLSCAVGPRPAMATNICIRNNALSSDGRVCDLERKGITNLKPSDFKGLTRLKTIYLNYNKLESLPSGIFNDLPSLERLGLDGNNLIELPQDIFKGLNSLEAVGIGKNQLVQIPENVFNGLQNLEEIYLGRNNLVTLPAGIFKGLKNLETISLFGNNFIRLPGGIFKDLESLESIDLREPRKKAGSGIKKEK